MMAKLPLKKQHDTSTPQVRKMSGDVQPDPTLTAAGMLNMCPQQMIFLLLAFHLLDVFRY